MPKDSPLVGYSMKSSCFRGVPQECADGPLNPQQLLRFHWRARALKACARRESSRGGSSAQVCVCVCVCVVKRVIVCGEW